MASLIPFGVLTLCLFSFATCLGRPADGDLLKFVKLSPAMVAVHNKSGWLDLFQDDAFVEDPVGTSRHEGLENLSKFYDVFIAPTEVTFSHRFDIVSGNNVLRFVNITATPTGTDCTTNQPAVLWYKVRVPDTGDLAIRAMEAHWQLQDRIHELMGERGAVKVGVQMSERILKYFGMKALLQYGRGVLGIGSKGIEAARAVNSMLNSHDGSQVEKFFQADSAPPVLNCESDFDACACDGGAFFGIYDMPKRTLACGTAQVKQVLQASGLTATHTIIKAYHSGDRVALVGALSSKCVVSRQGGCVEGAPGDAERSTLAIVEFSSHKKIQAMHIFVGIPL